jgi:CAAX protease family protein
MGGRTGPLSTIAVLALALGGPPLLALLSKHNLGGSTSIAKLLPYDLTLWAILAIVLANLFFVERQPPASIGLRRPGWSTIKWAIVLFVCVTFVLSPATIWIVNRAGLPGYEHGLPALSALPVWYRIFLAVSAGIVEEVLYRGYAIERLASITGSYGSGGAIAVIAFGVVHIPGWGLGPATVAFAGGAVATLFYIWKRDLPALMIAHALGDTVGLVLLPPVGRSV